MKRYDVIVNGMATTLLLSDADAAARGLTPATKAAQPANKAKAPANKAPRKSASTKRAEAVEAAFGPGD